MRVVLGIKSGLYMCQVGNVDSVNIFNMDVFVGVSKTWTLGTERERCRKILFLHLLVTHLLTNMVLFKKGGPSEYLNLSVCYDAMYLSNPLISP